MDIQEPKREMGSAVRAERAPQKKGLAGWQKIIVGIFILAFLYLFYVTLDANKYQATVLPVEGAGRVGVNPTTELLDFGDLSPGTSATRVVTIENDTPLSMFVFSLRFGSIAELMDPDKNFFVLPARGEESIEFEVYMPASATIDERLDGRVFLFKLPGPWGGK